MNAYKHIHISVLTSLAFLFSSCNKQAPMNEPPRYVGAYIISEEFKSVIPNNTKLKATEIEYFIDEFGNPLADYQLEGCKLEKNTKYRLECFYAYSMEPYVHGLQTDEKQKLHFITQYYDLSSAPVTICVDAAPGAKSKLFFSAEKPPTFSILEITPRPIKAIAKDGARFELWRFEKGGNLLVVDGHGLAPKETVTLETEIEGKVIPSKLTANSNGICQGFFDLHAGELTEGKLEGDVVIKVIRKGEVFSLPMHWSKRNWGTQDKIDYALIRRQGFPIIQK